MSATLRRSCLVLLYLPWLYTGPAPAQSYPARAIQLILPYVPGSSIDVVFRIIAPKLSENLGEQVIVVNRPGGAGTIGINAVAKAAPDGYVLGVATLSFATNPHFMVGRMPYDTEKDLAPVSLVTRTPLVLTVNAEVPARSVKELIALAKANPGALNYASAGVASSSHLAAALFASMSGIKITHIPFSATGARTGLSGGQTQLTLTGVPSSLPIIKSGRVIALAVSTAQPVPALPGVPTLAEAGVPGFEVSEWAGVLTTSGTPHAVINRLYQEIVKTVGDAEVRQRVENLSVQIVGSSPEEFGQHIKKELATWAKVAEEIRDAEKKQ